jgi:hypothetical protein
MTTDDRVEIEALLDRHQLCIDLRDNDGYAAVYTENGSYESPFASARGTAQLTEMMARLHASGFTAGKRHFSGPSAITVDGDRAAAVSSWWRPTHSPCRHCSPPVPMSTNWNASTVAGKSPAGGKPSTRRRSKEPSQ